MSGDSIGRVGMETGMGTGIVVERTEGTEATSDAGTGTEMGVGGTHSSVWIEISSSSGLRGG